MPCTADGSSRLIASIKSGQLQLVPALDELPVLDLEWTRRIGLPRWRGLPDGFTALDPVFMLLPDDLLHLDFQRQESLVGFPIQDPSLISEILAVPHFLKCSIPSKNLSLRSSSHSDVEMEASIPFMDGEHEWPPMRISACHVKSGFPNRALGILRPSEPDGFAFRITPGEDDLVVGRSLPADRHNRFFNGKGSPFGIQ